MIFHNFSFENKWSKGPFTNTCKLGPDTNEKEKKKKEKKKW